ncbi:MAG: MerR family transcriptional regulator [Myxococcota bacterium]|nr:MerR family transcriptional regulator [Myxococcota bacterium]
MAELLKMGELAARTGVEKSTIQHYLREGLLPGPAHRPHRNMAYYSADLVERIGLIRELQTRRSLSLARIRDLLADHQSLDAVRRWLDQQELNIEPSARPVGRKALRQETGLRPEELERLEALGFVRPRKQGRGVRYSATDSATVRSVGAMRRAGLNEENGFELEHMAIYLDSMRRLLAEELDLFSSVLGKASRSQTIALAEAGLEGTSALLVALRRRVIMDLLEDAEGREEIE